MRGYDSDKKTGVLNLEKRDNDTALGSGEKAPISDASRGTERLGGLIEEVGSQVQNATE